MAEIVAIGPAFSQVFALTIAADAMQAAPADGTERIRSRSAGSGQAFPFPAEWSRRIGDDVLLCRCEEINVGTVRCAVTELDIVEINRLKAMTRIGMGRCQGRFCAAAAVEILAQETGADPETVGRLRSQPPVKPLPIAAAPTTAEP